jgi:mono/diheme cytochrome c family protein
MKETIDESLRFLTDEDIHSIVAYLKSVPAEETHANANAAPQNETARQDGQAYLTNCASRHRVDGKGVAGAISSLVGNSAVLAEGPENLIRVALRGLPASHGLSPMPAVGAGMSDQDVADAANHVRSAWGNSAPGSTGAGSVAALRQQT